MPNRIIFIGTGGGRHSMASQVRKTGGTYVELDGMRLIIDPGPGALVYSHALQLDHEKWDGMLLSHYHIDNSSDANALIDIMKGAPTEGEKKDIFVVAEEHSIRMKKDTNEYPRISKYHQKLVKNLFPAKAGEKIKAGSLSIETTRTDHGMPCIGFVIRGSKSIGYAADGAYFTGQEDYFKNCDILILNTLVPKGGEIRPHYHMSVDGAIKLIKAMPSKPKLVVLTHFSPWMLRSNLYKQVKIVQDATGVRTIFAEDFMELDVDSFSTRTLQAKL